MIVCLAPTSLRSIKEIERAGKWRPCITTSTLRILESAELAGEILIFALTPLKGWGTTGRWVRVYLGPRKWLGMLGAVLSEAEHVLNGTEPQE